ncbi:hypothetical protein TUM4261_36120 [Shewanella sp. c952]|uniref:hypothetical protein n=1 Tax=Shewanella sp. c952 TaxID=2815913 RepID=UPI001BBE5600|nr:hypothetical protein [Shewanella sp. c952]GIU17003.1 hypothetical protein TUM4261_36120 [Shewanella sp. c952]
MFFKRKKETRPTLAWERLDNNGGPAYTFRTKVPGGWLVATREPHGDGVGSGATFLPDPNHQWNGYSLGQEELEQQEIEQQVPEGPCAKCKKLTNHIVAGQYKCGWCD